MLKLNIRKEAMSKIDSNLRNLPSVDKVLSHQEIKELAEEYSREAVLALVRKEIEKARVAIHSGQSSPPLRELLQNIRHSAELLWRAGPQPVINATGVILHTNLGRAPLSQEAMTALNQAAAGYSNLEYDLLGGERGNRMEHVEHLLCQLTGAEGALVVNNNASAILLALKALAENREVVVSRGEAVEIGGGFRIPDVLRQSGAQLVEVGTTNRTYIGDYEQIISEKTAALLKVHTSNFKVMGFTYSPSLEELISLGRSLQIVLLYDLGSGCLLDTTQFGLAPEPTPQESIARGVDLVFFSGDKLLGGPQAGIVIGKEEWINQLKRHPLTRALRIDKLCLAALAATLLHYIKEEAPSKIPVWCMITTPLSSLEQRALAWAEAVGERATIITGESTIGGGSLPGETLPTKLLALSRGEESIDGLAQRLRQGEPPVIGRIEEDRLLLDPRTVLPEEDEPLLNTLRNALKSS